MMFETLSYTKETRLMTEELKPCPFCGAVLPQLYRSNDLFWEHPHNEDCLLSRGLYPVSDDFLKMWNTRADPWCYDMDKAPKDGTHILVWYDHDADPYWSLENPNSLTDYAAWAESGNFMGGTGICIAAWQPRYFETTDEYGSGYWFPAYWFAYQNKDYECVVHPIAWMSLSARPSNTGER